MPSELGKAYINIVPKAENISGEVERILGGAAPAGGTTGKKTGQSFLAGLKKTATVVAVGKIIKDAFSAGGDLQQSFGGLDTLYESSADIAKNYAFAAAQAGISANNYAEQAVSMGAALKAAYGRNTYAAMQAANTAILDMADNAAKMGTPLEQIQSAYQGFARGQYQLLDNLKLGYGGTKSEMERLLADAQKLTGVEYNIDNLGDVYAAVHVIQQELGLTGVAAVEAKTTLTGSFGALKASWTNTLAAITTGEGIDEALANLSQSFGYFSDNVIDILLNVSDNVPMLVSGLLTTLIDNAPQLIAGGIELIVQLAIGFIEAIPELIDKIPEIFSAVVDAFKEQDWAQIGSDIINSIWEAMKSLWEIVSDLFSELVSSLHGTAYIDVVTRDQTTVNSEGFSHSAGKFASGLDYVPYDNFPAYLHTGEMVVPASLASQLRAANIGPDTKSLNTQPAQAVAQPINVNVSFTGSLAQLARVLQPVINVEAERRGPQLIK